MIRDVEGKAGLAYQIMPNLVVGADFSGVDQNEKINSKSIDITDVQILNFRGETYCVKRRASEIEENFRTKSEKGEVQIYYAPYEKLQLAFHGGYGAHRVTEIVPASNITYEEAKANFKSCDAAARVQYTVDEQSLLALDFEYSKIKSWTRNSIYDMLLWDWNTTSISAGIGASHYFATVKTIVATEISYIHQTADSVKYIDARRCSINSDGFSVKAGIEHNLNEKLIIRLGGYLMSLQRDFVSGGKDYIYKGLTAGGSCFFSRDLELIISEDYSAAKAEERTGKLNALTTAVSIKVYR